MAVTVTAATSKGEPLDEREWGIVTGACDMLFALEASKATVSPTVILDEHDRYLLAYATGNLNRFFDMWNLESRYWRPIFQRL